MSRWEIFLGPALAPYFVFLILLLARPLVNRIRRARDSRLKRFLLWRY